jgi:hypothetical protein
MKENTSKKVTRFDIVMLLGLIIWVPLLIISLVLNFNNHKLFGTESLISRQSTLTTLILLIIGYIFFIGGFLVNDFFIEKTDKKKVRLKAYLMVSVWFFLIVIILINHIFF